MECTSCGMPAPASTKVCAYCLTPYPATKSSLYNLIASGDTYKWASGENTIAVAKRESGLWHLFSIGTGERALTLVAIALNDRLRVALLDSWLRTVATVVVDPAALPQRNSPPKKRGLGFVRNRRDEVVLAVYGDGPTSVHLVNRDDDVVALVSPLPGGHKGFDVLVTNEASAPAALTLGGVLLAVELARAGQLHPVS